MKLIMESWRKYTAEEEKPADNNAKLIELFQSSGVQAVELGQMVDADQDMVKTMAAVVQVVKEFISTADETYPLPANADPGELIHETNKKLYQLEYGIAEDRWSASFQEIRSMIKNAHREIWTVKRAQGWPSVTAQKKYEGSREQLEQWAGV
jgi:hypothetical protein